MAPSHHSSPGYISHAFRICINSLGQWLIVFQWSTQSFRHLGGRWRNWAMVKYMTFLYRPRIWDELNPRAWTEEQWKTWKHTWHSFQLIISPISTCLPGSSDWMLENGIFGEIACEHEGDLSTPPSSPFHVFFYPGMCHSLLQTQLCR